MVHDEIVKEIKELRKEMSTGLEKHSEKLHQTNIILSVQREQLKEHMRRSDSLEMGQKLLKQEFENRTDKLESVISPIQKHINFIETALKYSGLFAGLAGFLVALKSLGVF